MAFVYWVLWRLEAEDFPKIADLADELLLGAWITAEIRDHAAALPTQDQAAIRWHYERSYGRDPVHELDPLPKPDLEWTASALRRGDEGVAEVIDRTREAARRRGTTVRELRERD